MNVDIIETSFSGVSSFLNSFFACQAEFFILTIYTFKVKFSARP